MVVSPPGEEAEDSDFDMPKVYEPVESYESLTERLTMFLGQYNESIRGAGMDMVFFRDAVLHLVKVSLHYIYIKGHLADRVRDPHHHPRPPEGHLRRPVG